MNDLSTVDRLVEFGMGTALASQMINTMNQAMANMNFAGVTARTPNVNASAQSMVQPSAQAPSAQTPPQVMYYAAIDGHQAGPLNVAEIKTLICKKLITTDTLMWCPGMEGWRMAQDIPEVNKLILLA
ncbi:MAG: DUF4339 domain-containing protein [Muribaculaceae bacterium]|nr:DUF4339 domain-containing protein [Muribaculaceae bacterium]